MNANIGIDIGGFGARMCVKGRGVVMNQSSAWAARGGETLYCGDEAYEWLGRAGKGMEVAYPFKGGAIAREDALCGWLSYLLERAGSSNLVNRPRLLIARAPSMEATQMKRLVALALDAGASACTLVRSDVCAALGAGCDVAAPKGSMVIDVGAHAVNAALIVMNTVVFRDALPMGAHDLNGAIARMLAARYALSVGPRTAEALKASLAAAAKGTGIREQVVGMDGVSGFPRSVEVAIDDVAQAVEPLLAQVALLGERMVVAAGHEYARELIEDGIVLTGGGARIYGLAQMVAERAGVKCRVADAPELATARGLAAILEKPDAYERLGEAQQNILERRLPGVRR